MLSTPPFLYSSLMSSSDDEDYNRGGELEEELSDDLSDAEVMAGDADMPAARSKGPLCPAGPLSKQAKMRARLRFLGRAHLYAARPDRDPFFVAILLPSGRFQYAGDPGLIGALRDVAPTLKAAQAVYSHEQRVTQSTAVCARDTFLTCRRRLPSAGIASRSCAARPSCCLMATQQAVGQHACSFQGCRSETPGRLAPTTCARALRALRASQ